MTTLIITILLASLAGSLHCAGMCGPIVVMATSLDKQYVSQSKLTFAYHTGRFIVYTILGIIAGTIGLAFNLSASLIGIQQIAAIIAGFTMILFGIIAILRIRGYGIKHFKIPQFVTSTISKLQRFAYQFPPTPRSFIMGLLTAILPCGWLWAFLVAAAGTGSPILGGIVMATFFVGTVPILLVVGLSIQHFTQRFKGLAPTLLAMTIVLLGFYMIVGRMLIDPASLQAKVANHNHTNTEYIESINKDTPACCKPNDK